jgi:hypothetical protein
LTKQSVLERWFEPSGNYQASLGNFARFDSTRCRWRIENGTDDPACTMDDYGQARRRGWVNAVCDETLLDTRAKLLAAWEPVPCEYELTAATREVC